MVLTRRVFILLATFVFFGCATPAPSPPPTAEPQGKEIGEPNDIALRRLEALHDVYGTPDDRATMTKGGLPAVAG
jgi:hypothetical protein